VLKAEHLTYIYGAGTPFERRALDDISFSVQAGEIAGLIGHTGSGKSTLAQHLNALLKPLSGRVLLDGTDIWDKKDARNARFQVGLVFQYPEYQLFEETVYKDIAFGVKNKGVDEADGKRRQPTESELDISVYSAMDFVHLPRELADKSPFELSGGQKRRAAIAGVIAMMPKVLILDEPTAGLDPQGRREILGHIKAYRDATGASVVLISHSMDEVARLADSITVLSEGKTAMSGTPRAVFGRADELEALHLSVPAFTKVFRLLREMGVDIDDGCYTAEAAEAELLRVKSAVSRGAGEETC
jgi:energy-coupling factor transport system ATP-binding protein